MTPPVPKNLRLAPDWMGRKSNTAVTRILDLIGPVNRLVEPFGGTGAVTLASPAEARRWNDIDPRLCRLALAVQVAPHSLAAACGDMPIAEPEASKCWADMQQRRCGWTAEEIAWATCFTFGGRLGGRIHTRDQEQQIWYAWLRCIPEMSARMRGVSVSCMEWQEVLADHEDWAVYADPPYAQASGYDFGGLVDYKELFSRLEYHPVAVVSGWAQSTEAPKGWKVVPSPRKAGREKLTKCKGDAFRTECEWIWRKQ